MKFIDLFAGMGGFRIALERNESECVYSSEWDKYAQITYKNNFGELPEGDITKVDISKIPDHDILCGGFPCQAFSISGKQGGFNDARGTLFFEIAKIVKKKKPKIIFLENVKNLGRHDNGKTLNTIENVLNELGYNIFHKLLNSSHYGVPQNRQRIFIIGLKRSYTSKEFEFPTPTCEEVFLVDVLEKNVPSHFFVDRPDITFKENNLLSELDLFDKKKYLRPIRIGTISKGGQGERIYSPKGHSITLSAYGGGIAGKTGAYLINNKVRQLTPRECLRVQGFPEDYSFPHEITRPQKYKMCGNSVTVPVIEKIFKKIQETIF